MKEFICPKCGYIGKAAKKKNGGSKLGWITILLIGIPLPGFIWTLFSRARVCRHCGNEMLIDTDSVVGRRLMAKYNEDPLPELAEIAKTPIKNNALKGNPKALDKAVEAGTPVDIAPKKPVEW